MNNYPRLIDQQVIRYCPLRDFGGNLINKIARLITCIICLYENLLHIDNGSERYFPSAGIHASSSVRYDPIGNLPSHLCFLMYLCIYETYVNLIWKMYILLLNKCCLRLSLSLHHQSTTRAWRGGRFHGNRVGMYRQAYKFFDQLSTG